MRAQSQHEQVARPRQNPLAAERKATDPHNAPVTNSADLREFLSKEHLQSNKFPKKKLLR
jgi:hypothetical protein